MAIQFLNTVQVDTSVLYVDAVNNRVGIGTASPSVTLHVDGWTRVNGGLQLDGSNRQVMAIDNTSLLLGTNNTERMRITSTGNVGIGTTSPNEKLDVNGITISKGFRTDVTNTDYNLLSRNSSGNATLYVQSATSNTNQPIAQFNYGSAAAGGGQKVLLVAKDNSYFVNTNVGIGTTSPQEELHIASTVPVVRIEDTDGGYAQIVGSDGSLSLRADQANTVASSIIDFTIDNSEKMRILANGNVGIGTSNPSTNLQVIGTVRADVFGVQDDSTNPSGNTSTRVTSPAGATYDDQSNSASTGVLSVILPTTATSTMLSFTLRVFDYANNESFDVNVAGYWYSSGLWTNTSVRIESQGDVERNFNVRFGKNNNNNKGWVGVGETTTNWSYVKFAVLNFQAAHVNDDLERWNDLWDTAVLTSLTDYTTLVTKNNNQVNNWARNGEDLYYGSGTGNVGIGPTSPVTKLHLYDNTGTVGLSIQADNASNSDINLGDEDDIDIGRIQYSHSTDSMILQTNNAERMRINSSGVIQFNNYNSTNNTGTPTYLLGTDASGNIVKTNTIPGSGVGPYLPLSAGSSYPLTGTLYGTSTNFSGSGDYAGNMTLGTGASTAEAHLQIGAGRTGNGYSYIDLIGDATYSDYGLRIIRNNTGANTSSAIIHRGTGNLEIATVESSSVLFKTGNSEKMRILATGNVGIGTTNPTQLLHVYSQTSNPTGIGVQNSQRYYSVRSNNYSLVFTDETVGNERMRIDNNGNVGIGTTSPQQKLHVAGNGRFESTGTGLGGYVTVGNPHETAGNYSAYFFGNTIHDNIYMKGAIAYETLSITSGRGDMHFLQNTSANGTNASINDSVMTIRNNGNVGIGTTSPNSKLQVDGEIDANGGGGYKINGKPWANESSNNLKLGDWDGEAFTTSIFDENSAEIVTIGNYGTMINCSSLTSTYGTTATLAVGTAGATSSGAAVVTLSNSDTTSSAGDATGIIQFAIKDDSSGNLGYTSASIKGSISQVAGQGNGGGGILDFNTAPWSTGSSPQTRMRINQNGNVGIGTTSPSEKLEVNGSVKATASTDAYKGYIKQTITSSANEKVDNADYNLIPYNTLTTTSSDQSYNRMVAAYDGRIKKVYIKNTGGNTPTSDTVNFKKQVNNTTSSTVYSATVANAGSAGMSAVYNFADNDFTFSEGDTFGILYQTVNTGGGARSMGGVAINIIIEYNIT